ncbi:hypothetical protein B4U80_12010 [Leptotrombidium deliense]|uniref:Acetylserotonin O-methyltransferase n=1 Tax=Leptotrombidium deliense TaxID=299467 RepID=A0A443RZS5_9ACAR|nr:hypothetical protein B4U80_12010 [Leptotrombidium deliense]
MRALESIGLFKQLEDKKWSLNAMADLLRENNPNSQKKTALSSIDDHRLWSQLTTAIQTGESVFEKAYGSKIEEYVLSEPNYLQNMMARMRENQAFCRHITDVYDFNEFKHIVDIGGHDGSFLASILKKALNAKGTVFDLEYAINNARKNRDIIELGNRVDLVAGDFFKAIPADGDCYIMKSTLVDWDDEKAVQILKNIACQMKTSSKLLILEACIPESNEAHFSKILDVMIVLYCRGKFRTKSEFEKLFKAAGLRLNRIVPLGNEVYSVIEATL